MLTLQEQRIVIDRHFGRKIFTRVKIIKVQGYPFLNGYFRQEGQITSMRLDPNNSNKILFANVRFDGGRIVKFPVQHLVLDHSYGQQK